MPTIDACITENEHLNSLFGPISLTQLAALKGNVELANILYELGVFKNSSLPSGASVCHLAALKGHLIFLQNAARWGCDLRALSKSGLSAVDVFETIYPDQAKHCPYSTLPLTLRIMTSTGSVIEIPLTLAEEEYHFIYTDRVCINAATVENSLISHQGDPIPQVIMRSTPSSVAIVRIKDRMPDLPIDPGLGLIASDRIPAGTDIGRYSGIFTYPNSTSLHKLNAGYNTFITPEGEWYTGVIDGEFYHGLIPLAADGFPNTVLDKSKEDGDQHLVTARDIAPGEFLLWDYGPNHPVKYGPYIHFAGDSITRFLLAIALNVEKVNRASYKQLTKWSGNPEFRLFFPQLLYFFSTPRIFLEEVLNDRVSLSVFNEEFQERIRIRREHEISEQICHLGSLFSQVNTPEKRKALWRYLEKIGREDFRAAYDFYKNHKTIFPPKISDMSQAEFEAFLASL